VIPALIGPGCLGLPPHDPRCIRQRQRVALALRRPHPSIRRGRKRIRQAGGGHPPHPTDQCPGDGRLPEDGVDILLHEYYQASDQNLRAVLTVSQPALMETVAMGEEIVTTASLDEAALALAIYPGSQPAAPAQSATASRPNALARQLVSLSPRRPGARVSMLRGAPLRQDAMGTARSPSGVPRVQALPRMREEPQGLLSRGFFLASGGGLRSRALGD
jgi:hypothetical protein